MCIKTLPGWLAFCHGDRRSVTSLICESIRLRLTGKLLFEPPTEGIMVYENGRAFKPFRKAIVSTNSVQSRFPVLFKVQFRFRNLPFRVNRLLSWLPVPLITGQPGFISKTWYQKPDSSEFMGIYEFNNIEAATEYWKSLPVKMMKRRAVPDSLKAEIITFNAHLGRYVRNSVG